jgi:hypothetical protein
MNRKKILELILFDFATAGRGSTCDQLEKLGNELGLFIPSGTR